MNGTTGNPWCVYFACWCSVTAGADRSQFRSFGGTNTNIGGFQAQGRWHQKKNVSWTYGSTSQSDGTIDPNYPGYIGDHVAVETDGFSTPEPDHVGFLVDQDDNYWYTIEGNISDKVVRKSYSKSTLKSSYDGSTLIGFMEVDYGDSHNELLSFVDPGNSFDAYIISESPWLPITVSSSNNAELQSEIFAGGDVTQIFHFEKTGSDNYSALYKITSYKNGYALDVSGGGDVNNSNIQLYPSNDSAAQRWRVLSSTSSAVQNIRLMPQCSAVDGVPKGLDVQDRNFTAGGNIQLYELKSYETAQQFRIWKMPGVANTPNVSVNSSTGSTTISWTATTDTRGYDIEIDKDNVRYKTLFEVTGTSTTVTLEPGTYKVRVVSLSDHEAVNTNRGYNSVYRTFTVPWGIKLNKSSTTIQVGNTETLTATVTPSSATNKTVTWTSSNTSVATVTSSGTVKGISEGTATITAKNANGNAATCTVTVTKVPATGISLNKTSMSIQVGSSETLTATVTPSNATDKSVTWTSSNTSVATVTSSGTVKGVSVGTATITARNSNGNTATCTVTVTKVPATGISLNKTSLSIQVGSSETLTATVTPSNATDKSVTWTSSNTSIATVTTSGTVKGVAVGTATITARNSNGYIATCAVTVTGIPATGISLNKTSMSIQVGSSGTLTATVTPSNATDKSVTWTSSNTSVASVSSSGTVRGISVGTATITAKNSNGNTATCTVTVTGIPATGISLNKTSTTIQIGNSEILSATVTPSNATDKSVTWTSSNISIASVSSSGTVRGVSVGTATITAKTSNGYTATCTVTVSGIPATGISLNKTSMSIQVGSSETLTATVTPSNATDKTVTWTSSNTNVATVTSSGTVKGISVGTATITAKNSNGYTATCTVTVTGIPATGISLNKTSMIIQIGSSETLTATVTPSNATDKTVTWTSSNTSVATVTSSGTVKGVSVGTATITAKNSSGYTAICAVNVTGIPATGISLNKTSMSIQIGSSETLTATVTPSNATNKTVMWTSSNTSIATVTSSGTVKGVAVGTATITAKNTNGNTATCTVTVTGIPDTSVSLNKTTLSLSVGGSEKLTATVTPSNATDKTVTWTSSNTKVVTVTNGTVKGISAGTATITVKTKNNHTATCRVTVTEDKITEFVRRLYRLCFNREADAGGLNNWVTKLRTGSATAAQVVQGFFLSSEMANLQLDDGEFIERCYLVMMDRPSDTGGKKNWVETMKSGVSKNYILRGFVHSSEFTNICNDYAISRGNITLTEPRDQNLGVTKFVSRCYSEVLGRTADVGGLNTWCKKINNASNMKQAAINMASDGFFHSAEYLNKHTTNDQYVRTLYRTFLGREADQGGYDSWMKKLYTGISRDEVLKGFANSAEFAKIMASYGIR